MNELLDDRRQERKEDIGKTNHNMATHSLDGTLLTSLSVSDVQALLIGVGDSDLKGSQAELLTRYTPYVVHSLVLNGRLPDSRKVDALRVPELRQLLRDRSLEPKGIKADLVAAAVHHLASWMGGVLPKAPNDALSGAAATAALAAANGGPRDAAW